jgi:hypothetical protein
MLSVIYAEFVKSIMLCVIMLSVIMLSVLAPAQECHYCKPNTSTAATASSTAVFTSDTANL